MHSFTSFGKKLMHVPVMTDDEFTRISMGWVGRSRDKLTARLNSRKPLLEMQEDLSAWDLRHFKPGQ